MDITSLVPRSPCTLAGWVVVVRFLMNTAGWMLTENGPPAVDRAGPDEDHCRAVTDGERGRGGLPLPANSH